MKIRNLCVVVPLAAVLGLSLTAGAATGLFATEDAALQTCGAERVGVGPDIGPGLRLVGIVPGP